MRGAALLFWFGLGAPRTTQAASPVLVWRLVCFLAFLSKVVWLHRASWSNMSLKWDAPFRGGFEVL